jgi:xylose isomerase
MNYAGRFNSFIFKGGDVYDAIEEYKKMDGITHLEFNYPEHIVGYDLEELKKAIAPLKVNGFAMRWRKEWLDGDFTNPNEELRRKAIQMAKDAADTCRELGGSVITLWFENDGFDYPFQMDYEESWGKLVEGIREVADYAPDMKISVEYKPFEERDFAMVDSAGMTLYLIHDVDRDNVGCTLDFCHMLMKHDNPAFGLALAASKGKLFGLHMNDGYGWKDSGLIFGSVNFAQAAEFIYYLERYHYDGVVFFDTFPIREESRAECQANINAFELIQAKVEREGIDRISEIVARHDGISAQKLVLDMLR